MRLIKEYEMKNGLRINMKYMVLVIYLWPSRCQGLHYLNDYGKSYHIMHPFGAVKNTHFLKQTVITKIIKWRMIK